MAHQHPFVLYHQSFKQPRFQLQYLGPDTYNSSIGRQHHHSDSWVYVGKAVLKNAGGCGYSFDRGGDNCGMVGPAV